MVQVTAAIKNKVGLHARPAVLFVQTASKFDSNIDIGKDGKEANAKSILNVLALDARCGDRIIIKAEGKDAKDALRELVELVNNKFGEE